VPRLTGRVDVALRKRFTVEREALSVGAAAGVSWLGPRPLPSGAEGDAYAVLDVSAHVGWRFVELGVLLTNLFDVRYERASFHYASQFDASTPSLTPTRHVAAGPPLRFGQPGSNVRSVVWGCGAPVSGRRCGAAPRRAWTRSGRRR
jgi:hypothetical protein